MAQEKKRGRKKQKKSVWLPILAGIMFIGFVITIFFGVLFAKKAGETVLETIPVMKISLLNTSLAEVHENGKDVKYGGNQVEIFDNGIMNFYDNVEFKGRGNFSWAAPKKSYRLKFEKKVDLFGMGKKKKWALIGNWVDDSLMRNDLAYFMSDVFMGEYKMEGQFVELFVDEEDLGVYYLVKTVEVDREAMDLYDPEGVLVELDNVYCESEEKRWVAENGDCLTVKDMVTEDFIDKVMEEFVAEYDEFLEAVSEGDFDAASEVVDMESFVKYFVFSEFTADPDAYATSWYLYKDGAKDKIHAGPVWDFDAAFGNMSWGDWPEGFYAPGTMMGRFEYTYEKFDSDSSERVCRYNKEKAVRETINISWLMCDFLEMPEFRELAAEVYERDLRDKKDLIVAHIYEVAEMINDAARKDAEMWGKKDFDEEVEYLVWWVEKRFEFFDEMYGPEGSFGLGGAAFAAEERDVPAEVDHVEPEFFF